MQAWEWALELRTEMIEFWLSPKGQRFGTAWSHYRNPRSPVSKVVVHQVEARKLSIAPPYFVTQEMCDLLEHASQTFPSTTLRPEDLPSTAGFVLLTTPHVVTDLRGAELEITAFAWGIAGGEDDPSIARGLHMSMYSRTADDVEKGELEKAWGVGFFPTLNLLHETAWVFDEDYATELLWGPGTVQEMDTPVSAEAQASGIAMLRFIHTFFILSQQKIGVPNMGKASRGFRRRAERLLPGRPIPDVRVITLRRYREGDVEHDPNSSGREYSHRWIRNGFWRQQPYGPGRKYRRPKYIAPHVCGPKDKPLVIKDDVFLWRR